MLIFFQKIEADSSALALQIENISAEMSELQTRLISALEQLSVCKNQQAVDEERISALSSKCVQLQTRYIERIPSLIIKCVKLKTRYWQ